jgi:hypothetical protein
MYSTLSETASVVKGLTCWPLVPKFAGSNPAEAVGFLRAKKSQHAFLAMSQICDM